MQKEPRLPERVRGNGRGKEARAKESICHGHLKRSCVRPTIWTYTRTNDGLFLEFAPQCEVARCFSRNSWYVVASRWYKTAQNDRRRRGRETVCRFTTLLSANAIQTCCVVLKERLPITFRILVDGCLLLPPSLALTIFQDS